MRVRDGKLESLERSVERHPSEWLASALGRAVDVSALAHLEQLETSVLPDGTLATAYLGLVPPGEELDGGWAAAGVTWPESVARARLRAKLSYTNLGFALAPEVFTISELRDAYVAALGHDVSATNLQRVLVRRGAIARVDGHRAPGRAGGRPAALFRFASRRLEVTDEFAALRPPR
jgi:8-oxo-dGTP diphosphatase